MNESASEALDCGSLLPPFAASLLALSLLGSRGRAASERGYSTHRQQAGWGKRQQAAALHGAVRSLKPLTKFSIL